MPPIDDANDNIIIINQSTISDSNDILSTLAHEGYPGHLYQYVYQRSLKNTGFMRNAMDITAYYEGWSQYAEYFFANNNDKFDNDYCIMMMSDGMISNVLLPSMVSIGVNAKGWDKEKTKEFLARR